MSVEQVRCVITDVFGDSHASEWNEYNEKDSRALDEGLGEILGNYENGQFRMVLADGTIMFIASRRVHRVTIETRKA